MLDGDIWDCIEELRFGTGRSVPRSTREQCKTTTVVSPETTVGTYSGFRENWAPTVVFSYSGPLLPTVVFCRPQADTISSSSGLEARRRRK